MKNVGLYTEGVGGAADFKVEVRAGCFAGAADRADDSALRDAGPCGDIQFARVSIKRLRAVVVLDNQVVSVAAVPSAAAPCDNDRACGGGKYAGAAWRADVGAVVAVQALGKHAAVDRPGVITAKVRPGAAAIYIDSRFFSRRFDGRRRNSKLAVRNDEYGTQRKRSVRQIVVFCNFIGVGFIFFSNRSKRVALNHCVFNADYRQNDKRVALADYTARKIVCALDSVDGYAEHLGDAGKRVALMHGVYGNCRRLRRRGFDIGRGAGWSVLREQGDAADHSYVSAADRRLWVYVSGGGEQGNGLGVLLGTGGRGFVRQTL